MEMKKLSIIIPVYNSENSIFELCEKLISEITDYNLEIVLVNDCSKDNSEKVCTELHAKYPNIIKFYSLSKNVGEHNAVMAGLNKSTGDFAIIMDDDFQNPVSEVVKLAQKISDSNYDVVYTYYDKKRHSFIRNLGSKFNDRVANIMLKKPKNLYLSSFKAINRFLIDEVVKYKLPFPYLDGLILRTTVNIGTIKVLHTERKQGKSGYTFAKLITLWMNMFTNFSIMPLRLSIFIGFIFSVLGFLMGVATVVMKISDPQLPMGYASVMFSVSIFSGIQLIAIGMVGEYLGRIFLSINKQAQYTIRKSFE